MLLAARRVVNSLASVRTANPEHFVSPLRIGEGCTSVVLHAHRLAPNLPRMACLGLVQPARVERMSLKCVAPNAAFSTRGELAETSPAGVHVHSATPSL